MRDHKKSKFAGKTKEEGIWVHGDALTYPVTGRTFIVVNTVGEYLRSYEINPETLCAFTGKYLCKGNAVYEGTIAFHEIEINEGDIRQYVICTWIKEWSMYAWLLPSEYVLYTDNGVDSLDEVSFFTYLLDNKELHHAGNIFDNPELLNA